MEQHSILFISQDPWTRLKIGIIQWMRMRLLTIDMSLMLMHLIREPTLSRSMVRLKIKFHFTGVGWVDIVLSIFSCSHACRPYSKTANAHAYCWKTWNSTNTFLWDCTRAAWWSGQFGDFSARTLGHAHARIILRWGRSSPGQSGSHSEAWWSTITAGTCVSIQYCLARGQGRGKYKSSCHMITFL